MDHQSTMNQPSQNKMLYTLAIAAALIFIGIIAWYFFATRVQTPAVPSALQQQNSLPTLNSSNTTMGIANDLSRTPDDSAALTQDLNSLNKYMQSF